MRGLPLKVLLTAAACTLAACATGETPKPTPVSLSVISAADANVGAGGAAMPVSVRIFQLTAAGAFEAADYFALRDGAQAALGADFVDQKELTLAPGAGETLAFEAAPNARHIGVVVGYRELDQSIWRAVVAIPADGAARYKVSVDKFKVSVTPAE